MGHGGAPGRVHPHAPAVVVVRDDDSDVAIRPQPQSTRPALAGRDAHPRPHIAAVPRQQRHAADRLVFCDSDDGGAAGHELRVVEAPIGQHAQVGPRDYVHLLQPAVVLLRHQHGATGADAHAAVFPAELPTAVAGPAVRVQQRAIG